MLGPHCLRSVGRCQEGNVPKSGAGSHRTAIDGAPEMCGSRHYPTADLDIPTVTLWPLSADNLARPVADDADILEVIEARMAEWIQGGLAQRLEMRILNVAVGY